MGTPGEMHERFEQVVLAHLEPRITWRAGSCAARGRRGRHAGGVPAGARFFDGFRGGDARAWLLKIVRNTSYSWVRKNRPMALADEFNETIHSGEEAGANIEGVLCRAQGQQVRRALETLPVAFREVLVLREIEGLSYKEISDVTGVPMGTVMSSLSRARQRLRDQLGAAAGKEA